MPPQYGLHQEHVPCIKKKNGTPGSENPTTALIQIERNTHAATVRSPKPMHGRAIQSENLLRKTAAVENFGRAAANMRPDDREEGWQTMISRYRERRLPDRENDMLSGIGRTAK